MKKILAFTFVLALLAFALPYAGAQATSGTVTVTTSVNGPLTLLTYSWTSDASGNVQKASPGVVGTIEKIETIPGAGTDAPTASYDILLRDTDGYDVSLGLLGNRSASAIEVVYPYEKGQFASGGLLAALPVKPLVTGAITLRLTAAGAANTGKVRIWLKN